MTDPDCHLVATRLRGVCVLVALEMKRARVFLKLAKADDGTVDFVASLTNDLVIQVLKNWKILFAREELATYTTTSMAAIMSANR